jgi:hypothetical protein
MGEDWILSQFHLWVPRSRMLGNVPFKDPSRLKHADALKWYHHLRKRQDSAPEEELFQFYQVYSGATPPPDWSDACSKTLVEHQGRNIWMLEYNLYVSRVQATSPISYSPSSWAYYYWIRKAADLGHWLGLPSVAQRPVDVPFPPEEIDFMQGMLGPSSPEVCEKLVNLLNIINQIELNAPFVVSVTINLLSDMLLTFDCRRGTAYGHPLDLPTPYWRSSLPSNLSKPLSWV